MCKMFTPTWSLKLNSCAIHTNIWINRSCSKTISLEQLLLFSDTYWLTLRENSCEKMVLWNHSCGYLRLPPNRSLDRHNAICNWQTRWSHPSSLCWHLGLRSFSGSPLRFRFNDQSTAQPSNEICSGTNDFWGFKNWGCIQSSKWAVVCKATTLGCCQWSEKSNCFNFLMGLISNACFLRYVLNLRNWNVKAKAQKRPSFFSF